MSKPDPNLEWLAFRYVAAELTAEEQEAFELRLADDQDARDAVAVMVELTQTLAAAEGNLASVEKRVQILSELPHASPESSDPRGSAACAEASRVAPTWWQPVAWMSAGALACGLLLVLASPGFLKSMLGPGSAGNGPRLGFSPATRELASAWWQTRVEWQNSSGLTADEPSLVDLPSAENLAPEDNSAAVEEFPLPDSVSGLLPPDWMMTAVEELTQEAKSPSSAE